MSAKTAVVNDMTLLPKEEQALATQQPVDVLAMIERLASNPDFSVDKMQALINMKIQIDANVAKAEFAHAFARMQAELPAIAERVKGDKWHYAPREDIVEQVRPILSKWGFSLSHETHWPEDKSVLVVGVLTHSLGHERRSEFKSQADTSGSKNAIQALGSSTEYGRRYTTLDLLGLVTRGMDDNGGGSQVRQEVKAPAGFEAWLADLDAVADEGSGALRAMWDDSKPEFRKHLVATNAKGWEDIKRRAAKANGGAK